MRSLFLILFSFICLNAIGLENISNWYKNKEFEKICSDEVASKLYYKYRKDEDFVNVYAYACLQTDMINRLADPITKLRKTKQARANALYYATILYQKKLLHHAVIDSINKLPNNLPTTEYILSKIYDMYVNNEYKKVGNVYFFTDKDDKNIAYKMYIKNDKDGFTKLVIQTFENEKKIKTRLYW